MAQSLMIKRTLFRFWVLCFLVILPSAYAQSPGPDEGPAMHPGQRIEEIYKQLKLTDDQKKQLEINKQQHRQRMRSVRQQMKAAHQELQEELMKPQLDMDRIRQLHGQIKNLLSQMEDDKLNSVLAVRAILTQEQFLEFVNLMHKHRQEHEE